jgi:hypothetical protein
MRNRDEKDGRYTRIFATERVNSFMKRRIYDRIPPFVEVIRRPRPRKKRRSPRALRRWSDCLRDIEDAPGDRAKRRLRDIKKAAPDGWRKSQSP